MKNLAPQLIVLAGLAMGLASGMSCAQEMTRGLNLSIKPRLLAPEFITSDSDQASEARLRSGLGLSLASRLLAVDVDYKLQSVVKTATTESENALSQQFNARLHSAGLNDLLGANAGVSADTLVLRGGDIYRYSVSPGISRSLSSLAKLSINYDFVLDKPSQQGLPKEQWGYSMMLDGVLHGGRLQWSGNYKSASVYEDRLLLTQDVEALDLKSRYQLGSFMHVELSSLFRHKTKFSGAGENVLREKRYGAAIAWSPSQRYALAFKVNTLEEGSRDRRDTFGSGTVSWFPRPDLEFTLDYGDQTTDGAPGWMLHTRFDISG